MQDDTFNDEDENITKKDKILKHMKKSLCSKGAKKWVKQIRNGGR